MYQNFELYNPCVILSAPIIIINHLLNVSYFGYILHTRLKSYISKFGAVQSLDNFICINNTYQPFAETFLFWLNPARKIQSTIGYHNTLYVLYIVHVLAEIQSSGYHTCLSRGRPGFKSLSDQYIFTFLSTQRVRFPPHTHLESVLFCCNTLEITGAYS